jgi:hypothetical protein
MRIQVTIKVGEKEKVFVCSLNDLSSAMTGWLEELGYPEKPLIAVQIKT